MGKLAGSGKRIGNRGHALWKFPQFRLAARKLIDCPRNRRTNTHRAGDGIMSAIDFDLQIDRLPNPRGDRVKITMSGKFLPYKYYGNSGNIPEYGYKEE
jgi:cyanate lyase